MADAATRSISVSEEQASGISQAVYGTLFASGDYTSTDTSDTITNISGKHLLIHIIVSANPGGGETLTPAIKSKTPISSPSTYTLLTGAAISGNGLTTLKITPNVAASANLIAQTPVPITTMVTMTHSDSGTWTYKVCYELLP